MKRGILFDDAAESDRHLHYDLICETWHNAMCFQKLPLSAKRKLLRSGYTEEKVNSFIPLMRKAVKWTLEQSPTNHVFDSDELNQWKELLEITEIICNGQGS